MRACSVTAGVVVADSAGHPGLRPRARLCGSRVVHGPDDRVDAGVGAQAHGREDGHAVPVDALPVDRLGGRRRAAGDDANVGQARVAAAAARGPRAVAVALVFFFCPNFCFYIGRLFFLVGFVFISLLYSFVRVPGVSVRD